MLAAPQTLKLPRRGDLAVAIVRSILARVEADNVGKCKAKGVWAAGEVACMSLHGANRLGCNSTAECLVWGDICGREIVKFMKTNPALPTMPKAAAEAEEKRVFDDILAWGDQRI